MFSEDNKTHQCISFLSSLRCNNIFNNTSIYKWGYKFRSPHKNFDSLMLLHVALLLSFPCLFLFFALILFLKSIPMWASITGVYWHCNNFCESFLAHYFLRFILCVIFSFYKLVQINVSIYKQESINSSFNKFTII